MKYSELQVKSNEKERLKDKLNEAEDKIMMLQKVDYVLVYLCMCIIRGKQ